MHEVNIIRELSHPNIIQYKGSFTGLDFGVKKQLRTNLREQGSLERQPVLLTERNKISDFEEVKQMQSVAQQNSPISGECLHIMLEYADGGDFQELIHKQLERRVYFAEKDIWAYAW